MKVYIVFGNVDYEGSYVESVHTTREGAEAFKAKSEVSKDMRFVDTVTVEEYEVSE